MPATAGTFRYNAEEYSRHFRILLSLINVWKGDKLPDDLSNSEDEDGSVFDARDELAGLIVVKINALLKFAFWAGEERTAADLEGALEVMKLLERPEDKEIAEEFKGIEVLYIYKLKALAKRKNNVCVDR